MEEGGDWKVVRITLSSETFEETPFVGPRNEMVGVASELQDRALANQEPVIYVAKPVGWGRDSPPLA